MINNLKQKLSRFIVNLPGWRTNRKIVVIESDDWGSIRMPSKEVYETLLHKGIRVDKCHYNKYDSLESEEDLESLFETLLELKDKNNNHPKITANTIVANPDFKKIKNSGFSKYFYEPFTKTFERYPKHAKSFNLIKQGIDEGIYIPQFHGREHLNVSRWMKALQSGSEETMIAFDKELFGISTTITTEKRESYLAALDFDDESELVLQNQTIKEGLELFEQIFGFRSKTFIAANYIWHPSVEMRLHQYGVIAFQGGNFHIIPDGKFNRRLKRHHLGESNEIGQIYLTRNAFFEPSENNKTDWVGSCLKEIELAFLMGKPAIISSHRVNFIGFIDVKNRINNLLKFKELLTKILSKWPDVEFMSSDQLALQIIQRNQGHEYRS